MSQMIDRDQEHLRLLSIGHYILAGMTALFSLFALLYVGFGALVFSGALPSQTQNGANPRIIGYVLTAIGAGVFTLGMAMAALYFVAGRSLRDRRRRIFCLIMAGLSCFYFPYGTVLGVSTLIVLCRPEVEELFKVNRAVTDLITRSN